MQYFPRADLTTEESEVERDIGRYFSERRAYLIRVYCRRFGNIVDRNNAQELYAPYAENRESRQRLSLATHEPAGALADKIYFTMVAKRSPARRNIVLFNAGGQGSGKTASLRFSEKSKQAFIVVDGTMQDFDKSCRNIDLALKNRKLVHINYVYCPFTKAVENIIRRATDLQGGRIVNIKRAAKGHFHAMANIFKIVDTYQDNFSVTFAVVDNSGKKPKKMTLEKLRKLRYRSIDALERQGYSAVDDYYAAFKAHNPNLTGELHRLLQGKSK